MPFRAYIIALCAISFLTCLEETDIIFKIVPKGHHHMPFRAYIIAPGAISFLTRPKGGYHSFFTIGRVIRILNPSSRSTGISSTRARSP